MITVLWIVAASSLVAMAALLSGPDALHAARNRVQLERIYWRAAGCAARTLSAIDSSLGEARSFEEAATIWRVLGRTVLPLDRADECAVHLAAAGTRLDVNAVSEAMLEQLFQAIGHHDAAPAPADALSDWRDSDDVGRPGGAERDWYVSATRAPPRNGPLADLRELTRIRGFESHAFDSVLSTEPGAGRLQLRPCPSCSGFRA